LRTSRESLLATESKSGCGFSSLGCRKITRIKTVCMWQRSAEEGCLRSQKRQPSAEKTEKKRRKSAESGNVAC
jgi:hypothetical protein